MSAKAIIFDMDNTILQSTIDFTKMRKTVFHLLSRNRFLPLDFSWENHTASQMIEVGRKYPQFARIEQELWRRVGEIEAEGMENAVLELYAHEVLSALKERQFTLTILTNNAYQATEPVLNRLSVLSLFDMLVCREQMLELKPSPSGISYILKHFPAISPDKWIMVGDSWIDGMAATHGGINFLLYKGKLEEIRERKIKCLGRMESLKEILDWV